MKEKLDLAIETIYSALTTSWEDNGNIMAEAVRDNVVLNLSKLTGQSTKEIYGRIEEMVEEAQK
jgi:hypothetical protein